MRVIAKSHEETWEDILSRSITTPLDLPEVLKLDKTEGLESLAQKYPMGINPYTLASSAKRMTSFTNRPCLTCRNSRTQEALTTR